MWVYQTRLESGGGSDTRGFSWTAVPFLTHSVDPLIIVGHLGVDAELVHPAAALAPGHQADQEPGVSVQGDHRSAAVPLAGVHPLSQNPGAEDVVGDVVRHLAGADFAVDQRDFDEVERRAEPRAVQVFFSPSGHHREGAILVEHPLSHLTSRQTNREDVLGEGGGGLETQQGDVVVHRPAVVVWVFECFEDPQGHFGSFISVTLVVA